MNCLVLNDKLPINEEDGLEGFVVDLIKDYVKGLILNKVDTLLVDCHFIGKILVDIVPDCYVIGYLDG